MANEKKKDGRGGYRKGAGRPETPYKIGLNVKITQEAKDILFMATGNNREFIDGLIRHFGRYADAKGVLRPEYTIVRNDAKDAANSETE